MLILIIVLSVIAMFYITNIISYRILKNKVLKSRRWDLNICCGKTDGGGINADIVQHIELPNYVHVDDITNLPFKDKQFKHVLCSHTIEHVDDPVASYNELQRVGENVVVVVPPLWDITAAFNIIEHKWLFLTMRPNHIKLPFHVKLPIAHKIQEIWGQKIKA